MFPLMITKFTKCASLLVCKQSTWNFLYRLPASRIHEGSLLAEKWRSDIRLLPDIQPVLYNLFLYPHLEDGHFEGNVVISISVKSEQPYIALNVKELNVTKCDIKDLKSVEIKIADSFEYKKNEFWVILLQNNIQPGDYKLYMEFNGKLDDKIVGFYSSQYLDNEGKKRVIVTSKFEPTFARQAFPCFDEPNFKAKYDIQLVRPSHRNFIALSNMNQEEEIVDFPISGVTTVKFATTLPMSTYLAVFIVCDFEHLEPLIADQGFPVTVYARSNQIHNMLYARDVALKVINYYVKYFSIQYPLPKLDLIAIPDFVSGAMENWGLITFRETSILYNEAITSTSNKFRVAQTVAHELAHMWFGDLVTMKWWNDLWLNEGYASYMEYKGVSMVHPDWDLDTMFLVHDLHSVLELDATLNSHPIVQSVAHPDQITEIFDQISYNKGASVIRMLEATIGEEEFRQGVSSYMKEFEYKNAETQDLWNHIQKYAPKCNITNFMDTWTRQMGFPLITVSKNGFKLQFNQKRFLADPEASYSNEESPFRYRWDVPITFITPNDTEVQHLWLFKDNESATMQPSSEYKKILYSDDGCVVAEMLHKFFQIEIFFKITFELPTNVTWFKVNSRQAGYYRVNYDILEWYNLISILKQDITKLEAADRASLLDDAFNLAKAEIIPYDVALKMIEYLNKENHYVPWSVAGSELLILKKKLFDTPAFNLFTKYVQTILDSVKPIVFDTSKNSSFLERYLQTTIFHLGCSIGHPDYISKANQMFMHYLENTTIKLNTDLASVVYYYGIQSTGEKEWNKLWELFLVEQNPQEKMKIMTGLCGSESASILEKYLTLSKNVTYVRSQDFLGLLANMAHNPIGNSVIWNFVRNEWNFLVDRYTLNDRYLGQLVASVTYNFGDEEKLEEMKKFFSKYPEAGAGAAKRKQALEKVQINIKWRKKHTKALLDWFEKNSITSDE